MTTTRNTIQKPLPKGWKMVRLAEVCSINPPKPVLKDDEEVTFLPMSAISDNGTVINRQIRLYGKVKKGYTGFIENDILFAKITPCMENGKGVIAKDLVNAVGFGSTEFHVVRASQDILPEIIFRYLSLDRIRKYAKNNMVGSAGQKRVPDIFLKSLQLPLPPLPTQHKIVEILEEADNLRKLRRQADEKMEDLIPSLFVKMFGDPATNQKGWEVKRLGDVALVLMGQSPAGATYNEKATGIPLLNGPTEFGNKFPKATQWTSKPTRLCKKGDILICVRGNTTGRMNTADTKYCIGRGIAAIRGIQENANAIYIAFLLEKKAEEILRQATACGSTFPNINRTQLEDIKIPLPPLPLQQEFSKLVEDIEAEKARQAESRKKLDELFNSLMQRAFTGELAV